MNIENNIPAHEPVIESLQEHVNESFQEPVNESFQEPIRQPSNLSNHVYEEIDYESRYEMPTIQNVKYENTIKKMLNMKIQFRYKPRKMNMATSRNYCLFII